MQIKFLQNFIETYKNTFDKNYDNSLEGKLQKINSKFNEPFMHLNIFFIKELQQIISSVQKPINVGIIGQFSSGKSSLLNLILQKDCLPTGVIPVTFKPTYLRYAKDYFLKVEFEDGSDEIVDTTELSKYTDQRQDIKKAKSLHIFAPIELLKSITLIDTPGLNANNLDSLTTFDALDSTHALIWLSLIDNAGKKSEEDAIKANLNLLQNEAICVLNQKDKLNQAELDNVLQYAHLVFDKYFKKIIAISCKEAKDEASYGHSNFQILLDYLQSLDTNKLKKIYIRRKLLNLCEILENEYIFFNKIFDTLQMHFSSFGEILESKQQQMEQKIKILNHQVLENLKTVSEKIAKEIFASIKEKEVSLYKVSSKFLHKGFYVKQNYKTPYISSDDIFLSMFYHNDNMKKEFKKMKNELLLNFNLLKEDLHYFYTILQEKIMIFKSEFSNIQKDNILQSDTNFAELRSFCSASEELFLKDFKENVFESELKLDLFFEELNLKALTNYESATKITLSFFSRKINESREFYELDSLEFSLFYPKISEIYERVLIELNVHEFEALLIDKPIILKIYKNLLQNFKALILQKNAIIEKEKEEIFRRQQWLLEIREQIERLE